MIALWMVHLVLVSVLLGLAARGAERVLRLYGVQARGVWIAAFAGSLLVPLAGALRDLVPAPAHPVAAATPVVLDPSLLARYSPGLFDAVSAWLRSGSAAGLNLGLLAIWLLAGAVAAVLYALTCRRLRAARRTWTPARLDREPVLVSAASGPAVVGIVRPCIVVPSWLLSASPEVQRLALLHEREHLRARDHTVLACAAALVLLMPWNLVLWWQLRRLRLAIEVDCDARVLRRGARARSYASMLLHVAAADRVPVTRLAAALVEPSTFLERRIDAMTTHRPSMRAGRALAFAAAAATLAVLACSTDAPMAPAETETAVAGDVAASAPLLETRLRAAVPLSDVVVSGTFRVSREGDIAKVTLARNAARARMAAELPSKVVILTPAQQAVHTRDFDLTSEVMKMLVTDGSRSARPTVKLRPPPPDGNAAMRERALTEAAAGRMEKRAGSMKLSGDRIDLRLTDTSGPAPLIMIDGALATAAQMKALDPKRIESIEVFKGAAALRLYGEGGRYGVIEIHTKR